MYYVQCVCITYSGNECDRRDREGPGGDITWNSIPFLEPHGSPENGDIRARIQLSL